MPARRRRDRRSAVHRLHVPAVAIAVAGLMVALFGVARAAGGGPDQTTAAGGPTPTASGPTLTASVTPQPTITVPPKPPVRYPTAGPHTWRTASGRSPVLGDSGQLLHFRVEVENGITGITPAEFAAAAVHTLGDPRSWTGYGRWRLQRVGPGEAASFTIYLATPATRDRLCDDGYDRYTSCRNGDSVVVNVARWAHGVPHFGRPLAEYQQYVINHEVGHRLGHGHELCGGPGKLAPVMQQQTLGLHGCKPNAWPLVHGRLHAGRSGAYDDPIPGVH